VTIIRQLRSPQRAAETALYLASCSPEEAAAGNGEYFEDGAKAAVLPCCDDWATQEHLWSCSQRLCEAAGKAAGK
jgi:hypothetical protein